MVLINKHQAWNKYIMDSFIIIILKTSQRQITCIMFLKN